MSGVKIVTPAAVRTQTRIAADDVPTDISVERLRIQQLISGVGLDLDITRVLTEGSISDSFTAAPQLVFQALDRDYKCLNSGIFDEDADDVEVILDEVPYLLVEVSLVASQTLELTFEHKIVALLRRHKKFLSVQRGSMTRAQFIELMLSEILPEFPDIEFVCPEINTTQKIGAPTKTGRSLTRKVLASKAIKVNPTDNGFTSSSLKIKDWTGQQVTLTATQLANAATLLQVCAQDNAPAKAVLALMEACLVEPPLYTNPSSGDGSSEGILQVLATTAKGVGIDPLDIVACADAFLTKGFAGKGGAIKLAQQHPTWSAGQIAQAVQGSAFPARYDQAGDGARAVIKAYGIDNITGTGTTILLSGDVAATKQYFFTRGRAGQIEDSYTCALRLAAEVQWRFFVAGARTVYFVTDDDLIAMGQTYTISPDTEGVALPTFDVEKGGRTVVVHRHRVPKPSEGQVAVRVRRWAVVPGYVIVLEGYGPADGKWLIKEMDRDLFDKSGTIYFQSPQKPLPEPAATVSTNTEQVSPSTNPTLTSANVVDRVYAAAQAISARNLPYVYGGGHTGNWQTAAQATGLDCSSSTSLALYAAGLMAGFSGPPVSGDFSTWGAAGRGTQMTVWYNAGHVFIQFYGRPAKRFDTVPGGSGGNGPHLRYTVPGSPEDTWEATGFQARHWPGY